MKNLFSILTVALCSIMGCTAQDKDFESLNTEDFERLISDTSVVRLDARTIEEYAEGHIAHAVNIDVTGDDFESKATALLPKDKTIAVYCRSGRRSKKAAGILAAKGYKVKELDSGITGWISAGKETVR